MFMKKNIYFHENNLGKDYSDGERRGDSLLNIYSSFYD